MSQIQQILEKLNEGRWVCSAELIAGYTVDYRARINDLRKKGYLIRGEPCKGRCGRNHNASLNWWYLETRSGESTSSPDIGKIPDWFFQPSIPKQVTQQKLL